MPESSEPKREYFCLVVPGDESLVGEQTETSVVGVDVELFQRTPRTQVPKQDEAFLAPCGHSIQVDWENVPDLLRVLVLELSEYLPVSSGHYKQGGVSPYQQDLIDREQRPQSLVKSQLSFQGNVEALLRNRFFLIFFLFLSFLLQISFLHFPGLSQCFLYSLDSLGFPRNRGCLSFPDPPEPQDVVCAAGSEEPRGELRDSPNDV